MHPKDLICDYIANLLSDRVVLWVIVRAYGHASTHECANKTPDDIGYSDLWHSWNNRIEGKSWEAEPVENQDIDSE